jgi:hypothetical protein
MFVYKDFTDAATITYLYIWLKFFMFCIYVFYLYTWVILLYSYYKHSSYLLLLDLKINWSVKYMYVTFYMPFFFFFQFQVTQPHRWCNGVLTLSILWVAELVLNNNHSLTQFKILLKPLEGIFIEWYFTKLLILML